MRTVAGPHAERVAEAADDTGLAAGVGGQRVGLDLDDERGAVVHQHGAVAVDDLTARRLDLHLAHAVVVGLREVLVARQHLQVPEAQEHDREQRERDPSEDRHAQRQLRCDDHAPVSAR